MKKLLVVLLCLLVYRPLLSQNFEPAPENKAVVYFASPYISTVGLLGFAYSIPLYNHDGLGIGVLTYRNFIRYECDPGEHYFWTFKGVYTQNISAIKAELNAGKIYLILAKEVMAPNPVGTFSGLMPVDPTTDNEKLFDMLKILNNKNSIKANKIYLKRQDKFFKTLNKNKRQFKNQEIFTKKIDKVLEKEKILILPAHWYIEPSDMYYDKKKQRQIEKDTLSVTMNNF